MKQATVSSWSGFDPAIHVFEATREVVDARDKVTLSLSQRSVTFFKRAARQRRVRYQRMIRALVDAYAEKQEGKG